MPSGGSARVLVELRARTADPSAVSDAQNRCCAAWPAPAPASRVATRRRRLLALEIDAAALARLEDMTGLVIRVRRIASRRLWRALGPAADRSVFGDDRRHRAAKPSFDRPRRPSLQGLAVGMVVAHY